jgi:saccharopine dehydrogenase-like NADP-dependent oxidoreductase
MKKLCLCLGALVGLVCALAAHGLFADARDTAEITQVLTAEQTRVAALDAEDVPALEKIMADDETYVHASGKVDTKASFLDAIRSGQLHYVSWTPKSMQVRTAGKDAAVVNGEYAVRVTDTRVQPQPFDISIFFLAVYARRDGRWQQIAWQSTRDVAASPAP